MRLRRERAGWRGIAVFVLLVAGYPGSTLTMQRTKTATARRRVLSLIGYAIVAALVFDVIIGPILGAYPNVGSNFWPLWGEFALMCLAVALFAATLQSLVGPLGGHGQETAERGDITNTSR
ncbi:hypothetical protein [Streptomyces erythrochromogenes]|uniref:hypothetical protein n=1 Tax=Streptomyces erythrochromogenes TaxID=285574 RepID=UPI0036D17119